MVHSKIKIGTLVAHTPITGSGITDFGVVVDINHDTESEYPYCIIFTDDLSDLDWYKEESAKKMAKDFIELL